MYQVRGDDRLVPREGSAAQRPESGSPELAGPVALAAGTILGLSGPLPSTEQRLFPKPVPVPA